VIRFWWHPDHNPDGSQSGSGTVLRIYVADCIVRFLPGGSSVIGGGLCCRSSFINNSSEIRSCAFVLQVAMDQFLAMVVMLVMHFLVRT